ncbi:MAG: hypothetical protein OK454_04540 [Thaumarchaeota archaeon]|nr:hypothetical protein [Nitrososphaerota archaeon]
MLARMQSVGAGEADKVGDRQWRAVERAALLAFIGKEGEAEAVRFAADYHNLATRADADG